MQSTSEAVADSIATQYAAAMDNAINDAVRMESERDQARAQLAVLREQCDQARVIATVLATRLRKTQMLLAALGAQELQGNPVGPVQLLGSGYCRGSN